MIQTGICQDCPLFGRPSMDIPAGPQPDIMFVGAFPMEVDIKHGAFSGKNSSLLRKVIGQLQRERPRNDQLNVTYGYACMCQPEYDEDKKKFLVNAEVYKRCCTHLRQRIDRERPKVLCALGTDAVKALGMNGTASSFRGGLYSFKCADGTEIPLVVTYHIVEVAKSPGLVPTLVTDARKAFLLARDGLVDVPMRIETSRSASEVLATLEKAKESLRKRWQETGKSVALAFDTETTSLKPYIMEERVIAVSLSWEDAQGYAFPFEHKDCPYAKEDFEAIKKSLSDLLSDESVFLLAANGKFDVQWLRMHYGLRMSDVKYDIILAEHVIDEDKKGEYSLKDITKDRFPSMGRYEEELQAHLKAKWEEKDELLRQFALSQLNAENEAVVSWWCGLSDEERLSHLSLWVGKGWINLSDTDGMQKVTRRKFRGEMVIPKKYQKAITNLLRVIPREELRSVLPQQEEAPKEWQVKSYEDADLDTLLRYAAIDALTTRMVCRDQQRDFQEDAQRIAGVERRSGKKQATLPLRRGFMDVDMPLSMVLADMEYGGARIDRDRLRDYIAIVETKVEEARDALFTTVGYRFNPSSSAPDLKRILYEEMKLPILSRTDSGDPSTDSDTLKDLSDQHDIPFLSSLLALRRLEKCLSTYLRNWLNVSAYDGKIHCEFKQTGTATYRLSSAKPNLGHALEVVKPCEFGGHP